MKILIAEDNSFSRTLLNKSLTKAGYDVIAVENGEQAWAILQQDETPLLALIDWMMPGLSGIDLCKRIRAKKSAYPVYIVLLTARTGKEDVLEGFAAGADDFIKKPFDSGELLARIQVGQRLVEQHALLHCLIDSIPDPIYFKDQRGAYLGCNKAYCEFVGLEDIELIHRTDEEIFEDEVLRSNHAEDLRVLSEGLSLESEGWGTNAANRAVYHNVIKIPYLESAVGSTGMIGVRRDITHRIEMEQEMKRLAVAVEQSTESILITDVDGRIRYVNAAFERVSGYQFEEVENLTPALLRSDKHDEAFYRQINETISAGEIWKGHIINRCKDGRLVDEETIIYPIFDDAERMVNYVSISRDITQELAIEKQLRQTQKMNAIGKLAGGVAHDFNNILTAILGYVALCMNGVDAEDKVYSYLKEIVKAGDRATKLIRQILTFSRQEEQDFQPIMLQPIIEDSLSMVRTSFKSKVNVFTQIDRECGPIMGDSTQIQQILVNLCTNSVQAIGDDPNGCLKVELTQVELIGKKISEHMMDLEPGLYCCITVRDTGCGMANDTLDRIFEPYFTTKAKGVGTGIGLAIVHGIVRKHNGYIGVESELGAGTTFTLYFPLIIADAKEEKQVMDISMLEGCGNLLFVDDDEAVRTMGAEILESFGFSVITAVDGQDAIELFAETPDAFDAVVTDFSMPRKNGQDLILACMAIRPDLPTVLCSGYMDEAADSALLPMTLMMPKPIDWRELSRTIQQRINQQGDE
jgi:PAS domain S-box-containing protein